MKTKRFDLRTILTCTTGRFLCTPVSDTDNGIGELYAMLGWITGDDTHQLPRVSRECGPFLIERFPELAGAEKLVPELDCNLKGDLSRQEIWEICAEWIRRVKFDTGAKDFYDVPQLPAGVYVEKDPVAELLEMRTGVREVILEGTPADKEFNQ